MNKRTLLIGGAGAAAAAAGLGWQFWRQRGAATGARPLDAASAAFWQSSFTQPDGQPLALSDLQGRLVVLNFWATWCPPCVKEMPELDRFARLFAPQGVRVVGLAVDNAGPVRDFLKRTPVSYSIGLAGFEGTELSRKLGNDKGALPFTAIFDRHGAMVQRKLGETTFDELARWVNVL